MENSTVRYTCVTCGACCKERLIPLTIAEAEKWLDRGDHVAIILEAFSYLTDPEISPEYIHNTSRAAIVNKDKGRLHIIAIFAANALKRCPNLQENNLCGIYEERPLVCRIYPMEINPFIELRKENKICPPESWGNGDILCSDGVANPPLRLLINESKQADVDDAAAKVAICESLGMSVASWKGDGLAVYFPGSEALLAAIQTRNSRQREDGYQWKVRTDNAGLREILLAAEIPLAPGESNAYIYQAL
ncbi:YkgJ family cysteine cluster protein [Pseudomonas sp. Z3-6]|uniref:YkgJ family cysteine cluster protein n=1 Tax=Pseudomonas sp. Z3-6 TaxID=2817411 RepID=UPI003DA9AE24